MTFDGDYILAVILRWTHILAAVAAAGGTFFARLALLPSLEQLPESQRQTLHEAVRRRWMKVVMAAIALLLASGLYNFVVIARSLPEELKPFYHSVFGVKFLLALMIFFIASALVGRSKAFERMRQRARFWLTLNAALIVLLLLLSGALRMARDQVRTDTLEPVAAQARTDRL